MCDNVGFETNMRTELLYLHPKTTHSGKLELPNSKISENESDESKKDNTKGDLKNIVGK
jgi:hypothetical protein